MLHVSDQEITKRLHFDNPWWETNGTVDGYLIDMPRRSYFEPFYELVTDTSLRRATILMGPRRVGKTVMVFHSIHRLLEAGIPGAKILYLSLETPVYTGKSLQNLLDLFIETHGYKKNDVLYVFFDEIQYLKDWEIHLKSLVDSYANYRFVATGSAAAALRLKSRESGAGRFTDFLLPPLTFAEYLIFSGKNNLVNREVQNNKIWYKSVSIAKLNHEFVNYLNYGGYPEAIFSEKIRTHNTQFIKSDIIDKVLLRDLPSLYGIQDIQELNRLFTAVAYNTGNEITLEALAGSSGVAKNTLKRYLEYLEAAFLIRRVNRVDQSAKRFQRATTFKVYLTNPSMRAALFGNIDIDDAAMGALTETAIYAQWLHSSTIDNLYYARWDKGEVDIVCLSGQTQTPAWIVEVKWSDLPVKDYRKIEGAIAFATKHAFRQDVLVTTRGLTENAIVNGISIRFRPSSEYAYVLGANILEHKFLHTQTAKFNSLSSPQDG